MTNTFAHAAAAAILAVLVAAPAAAWSTGPPADRVGLCSARATCKDAFCHDSFPLNAGTHLSTLALDTGPLPATYRVGELMRLLLTVTDTNPTRQRFGFELGAVVGCPFPADAGAMIVLDTDRTQLTTGGGLTFIEHTCNGSTSGDCGYIPPAPGMNEWLFDWQVPAETVGAIRFYWAVNAANGDGTEDGDYINLWDVTILPHCPGRIDELLLTRVDCDASSPGVREIAFSWQPDPYANGYRIYQTTDPLALAMPGASGATVVPSSCEPSPPDDLMFFTVVGVCVDASDGP